MFLACCENCEHLVREDGKHSKICAGKTMDIHGSLENKVEKIDSLFARVVLRAG